MTKQKAIEVLRNELLCRTTDCGDADCETCKYRESFDEINSALETAIAIMVRSVKS